MPFLGFSLAALIGLSLGLLGGGGSIITVPILVYVLGFGAKESIAMGLAVVGVTSLFGAAGHWRRGNVQLRAALLFGAVAMAGTYAGARLSVFVSGAVQLLLFATVMLVAAAFMFRNGRKEAALAARKEAALAPEPHKASFPVMALAALGVGGLTGVVGVGGGFLIVPALVLLVGLPMKQAVGTSLLVIALNSFVGFAGYLGHVEVPWGYLGLFTAIAVAGILIGTWASHHVSQAALKRAFSVFLVVMGVFIFFKNREALARGVPRNPGRSTMAEQPSNAATQWDARFSHEAYAYGTQPNDFLVEMASRLPSGGHVLSLGEGEGRNSVYLASLGHSVTAVDASRVGLQKAKRLAAGRGVSIETVVSDLADFTFEPEAWDAAIAIFCHLPPALRRKVHQSVVGSLRPGGIILLEAYTPAQLGFRTGGPPVAELLYTAEALREDFAGLELPVLREVTREVREGTLHTGQAAVVQLVGRKPT